MKFIKTYIVTILSLSLGACLAEPYEDVSLMLYTKNHDTAAVGKVSKIKKICRFSTEGPSDKNIVKELYWAEIKISKYLKTPMGSPPLKIRLLWFEDVLPANVKSCKNVDVKVGDEKIWFYNQLGMNSEFEGLYEFAFVAKKEMKHVIKMITSLGRAK